MCGKTSIYGVHIPQKCIESITSTHALVSHLKLQLEFFENLFPQDGRGGGSYDLLYQNSIRKYENDLNISLFIFCGICNFSKYDGITVL